MTQQSALRQLERGNFDPNILLAAGYADALEYMADKVKDWRDLYGATSAPRYGDVIDQYDAYRERHGLTELTHMGDSLLREWWEEHQEFYITEIYPWADGRTWCAGRDIIRQDWGRRFLDTIKHLHPGIYPAYGVIGFNLAMYVLGRITRLYQHDALPLRTRMPSAQECDAARDASARAWAADCRAKGIDINRLHYAQWLDANPEQKWLTVWNLGRGIDTYIHSARELTGLEVLEIIEKDDKPQQTAPVPPTAPAVIDPSETMQMGHWMPLDLMRQHGKPEAEIALPEPTLDATQGWLSPDGELYPCRTEGHNELQVLLERTFGIADLEKAGWMHLQPTRRFKTSERWLLSEGSEPTQRQMDAIFDWCLKHDDELPAFLKPGE
jgi:hypothetical protein